MIVDIGSRLYLSSSYKKCFFIIPCEPKYFIGGTLIRSSSSTISADDSDGKGEYTQSDGYAGNISAGFYDTFGRSLTLGLEVGYRMWMKRPDINFKSGNFSDQNQEDLEKHVADSPNVAITLGWLF